jgi:DnaJ-class molecular chaperone
MVACSRCRGEGQLRSPYGLPPIKCPACNGTGVSPNQPVSLTREKVFDRLLEQFVRYLEAQDARTEQECKELIFWTLKSNADTDYNFDL